MRQDQSASRNVWRETITRCPLFQGLPLAARQQLALGAAVKNYVPGEIVFSAGDEGDFLAIVLAGRVRVTIPSAEGGELHLWFAGQGEVLGEIAALDGEGRTASVSAQTSATLALIGRRQLLEELNREPGSWLGIVKALCARLRAADTQAAEIALLGLPARLANAILRLTQSAGPGAPPFSRVPATQGELGGLVGASREAVNRCVSDWQRRGVLKVEGARLSILDRAALQEIAREGGAERA